MYTIGSVTILTVLTVVTVVTLVIVVTVVTVVTKKNLQKRISQINFSQKKNYSSKTF